ncbi:DinB family protein [Seonamhaeicola maritimus]|uniref:DinB family protein n=1 Tax=Seonamhaeicola maritimus TaxID=2591822 RepID=A0A5C7GJL2_9FLAO|nr:DinB family protein [Seonamhaeicola maritimus]TXG38579.1 DinB family protein [Seonamhaeicola maritimus]
MNLSKQLSNRLEEVLLDGKWVAGTNIKEQISDLTWKQATTKIDSLNTISDLLFHINYYTEGLIHYFETGKLEIKDKFSFDAPKIESEKDWKDLIKKFQIDTQKLIEKVKGFTNEKLDQTFFDDKYGTYYRNINVIIEHSYYHFGQIVLIKKLLKKTVN